MLGAWLKEGTHEVDATPLHDEGAVGMGQQVDMATYSQFQTGRCTQGEDRMVPFHYFEFVVAVDFVGDYISFLSFGS